MWYLVGVLVTWIGLAWWGVIRANDTEVGEILETVAITFLVSLVWPISLIGIGISCVLFLLVNKNKEK